MTRFSQQLWKLHATRSAVAGRKRSAGVFIAWWTVFWALSVLSPCCDLLAASAAHGHSVHSMAADHDADHLALDHSPHPQCAPIVDVDMATPIEAPPLTAKLQVPDALWLPHVAFVSRPIRQSVAPHLAYAQPPPLPRLYLRSSRLLI